ncbi:MAG TPA: threonylcarbamoyl-AMP synthase [Algoriphagus sp.]|jgi:L-threonylcarbamoyladenylate synthase|uniref:L-threonylcarbamoyladenylate synthase n=1 Tax=unclassified Algoriphagus TaxID=2641541 RepID=UPI000C3F0982|nr:MULTISPECIES: L-threonylcarbamoyladenylate synthase [unclassified Algoriphagus]MAL14264.1 threonylcarbamoyl-AMP synthase [Algoriphagus sp.]QYH37410.1 threonylcarbamoyl-AMP synthase [Algoriphagus sp. NBT04N3]HAD53392.1 threonylcarbamoyl-AMP synthase [Algoriphagus sp.]HCD88966.1 threonylcarbamoyl-AMP synthase [Algoriphagus sp.]HCH45051.1 threonylcarbamoyl-AMP synthase [Algoriphagus sp.]|tara:strand:- start:440 stop:1402 length:963 start_codon:yes stop_codon:yes gene_type:complete
MAEIGKDIIRAKSLLEAGKLVGIPTETVYGLAGNALNPDAVASIFETKKRPSFDPLIIHSDSMEKIKRWVLEIPEKLKILADEFWPGPLTLLLPREAIVPDLVTSGLDRVAVRIPSHPLTLELLKSLEFPLAAPSANPFGYISPTRPEHVQKQLGDQIPYILDGGACKVGLESTIVGIEDEQIFIYRLGGLDVREIEALVGPVQIKTHSSSNPAAPGLLESHYAPTKPFILGDLDQLIQDHQNKKVRMGILSLQRTFSNLPIESQMILSEKGDLKEAAQNLFAAMRALDEQDLDLILAERMPDHGLGKAINDRLNRAAAK